MARFRALSAWQHLPTPSLVRPTGPLRKLAFADFFLCFLPLLLCCSQILAVGAIWVRAIKIIVVLDVFVGSRKWLAFHYSSCQRRNHHQEKDWAPMTPPRRSYEVRYTE